MSLSPTAVAQSPTAPVYTVFMQVRTTTAFLALEPQERFEFLREEIAPILADHPTVRMRFYDTEFFNAEVSDVVVFETADLQAYQLVVERLRETRFWGLYFEVVSILPGVENAYAANYGQTPIGEN